MTSFFTIIGGYGYSEFKDFAVDKFIDKLAQKNVFIDREHGKKCFDKANKRMATLMEEYLNNPFPAMVKWHFKKLKDETSESKILSILDEAYKNCFLIAYKLAYRDVNDNVFRVMYKIKHGIINTDIVIKWVL